MASVEKIEAQLRQNQTNVRFADLAKVCEHYFGQPRLKGSHHVYRMPWPGDPRVNIQDRKGQIAEYQVKQVLKAIDRKQQEGGTS